MKILLINNDKLWGGGQEHLKDLVPELLKHGVDVHLGVRKDSLSAERFQELGVPLHLFPGHGIGDAVTVCRLMKLFVREKYDVVSINREHDLLLTALAWRLALPFRGPGKLMMSYHTATSRRQLFLSAADAVVCVSGHVKNALLASNSRAGSKTTVISNGIAQSPTPEETKWNPDRPKRFFRNVGFPLIGMVGPLWKNQIALIDVLALLKPDFPTLKLALVGTTDDPAYLLPLQERIADLGLEEQVLFIGKLPRETMKDVFYDFDLSISTYRNEGFGLVHLESLAAGTPVVSFRAGGVVDILDGEDVGILVDGGPCEFAAEISHLLRGHERRVEMGMRGWKLVREKYSTEIMTLNYLELYRKLKLSA